MNRHQLLVKVHDDPDLEKLLLAAFHTKGTLYLADAAQELGLNHDYVAHLSKELIQMQLASSEQSLAGDIGLTPLGKQVAKDIVESYLNGVLRKQVIVKGVLQALYENPRTNSKALADHWTGDPLSPPVTDKETAETFKYLKEKGYIKGGTTAGRAHYIGMGITASGQDLLDQGVPLTSGEPTMTVNNVFNNQNASIGAQVSGDGNNVQGVAATQGFHIEQVRQLIHQALQEADSLPEGKRQDVRSALEDAQSVAEQDNPRPSAIKALVETASSAAMQAIGSGTGSRLMDTLAHITRIF